MIGLKKLIVTGIMVTVVGAASATAFAASSYSTPAEALAGLTGKTEAEVTAERLETGKTYGTIAKDAGKLEEFQAEMLRQKKAVLDDRVEAGLMTQENADAMVSAMEKNQALCDGTGLGAGAQMGAGFGRMNGEGHGKGYGQGQGLRNCGQ